MVVRERIKAIVKEVVEAFLRSQTSILPKQRIAILLSDSDESSEEILQMLGELTERYELILLVDQKWQARLENTFGDAVPIEELSRDQIKTIVQETVVLIVLTPTYHLVTRLALTMDDVQSAKIAIAYQLEGRPICIVKDCLQRTVSQELHAPYLVLKRIDTYFRQLQQERVVWVLLKKMIATVEEQIQESTQRQPVVFAKHVEQAFHNGDKILKVPSKSLITPMAKEASMDFKIDIEKRES